jgi:hypothetical protein
MKVKPQYKNTALAMQTTTYSRPLSLSLTTILFLAAAHSSGYSGSSGYTGADTTDELCYEMMGSFQRYVYNGCLRDVGDRNPCLTKMPPEFIDQQRNYSFLQSCLKAVEIIDSIGHVEQQKSCLEKAQQLDLKVRALSINLLCIAEDPENCAIIDQSTQEPVEQFRPTIEKARVQFTTFERQAEYWKKQCGVSEDPTATNVL